MRFCVNCKEYKEVKSFYKHSRTESGVVYPKCAECRFIKNVIAAAPKEVKNKRSARDIYLKATYRISEIDYETLLLDQNGRCGICDSPESTFKKRLAVDHCHSTGRIRGLLCTACNISLGGYQDSVKNLIAAIKYLAKSRGQTLADLLLEVQTETQSDPDPYKTSVKRRD